MPEAAPPQHETDPPHPETEPPQREAYSPHHDSTLGQEIEADFDYDSALGDDDGLESSAERYEFENGRRYHGFRRGRYHFPNDDDEADREDLKHHVTRAMLNGALHATTFSNPPSKVLDLGTGTGIWPIEFADENQASMVIAVDLSPIQPDLIPLNLEFQLDDVEDWWTFTPESFDFIHCRYMSSAIRDWPKLLQQCLHAMTRGGKIELVDMDIEYVSDDNTVKPENNLKKFMSDLRRAGPMLGIDLSACKRYGDMLKDEGFSNINTQVYKLPFGPWPRDQGLKEIGYMHREQFMRGMQGIAYGLYGRGLKWTQPEIEVLLADVRKDCMDKKVHGYWCLYFTTAERF